MGKVLLCVWFLVVLEILLSLVFFLSFLSFLTFPPISPFPHHSLTNPPSTHLQNKTTTPPHSPPKKSIEWTPTGTIFKNTIHRTLSSLSVPLPPPTTSTSPTRMKRITSASSVFCSPPRPSHPPSSPLSLTAMIWFQGESDSLSLSSASSYPFSLSSLLASFRKDLGSPDLPIFVVKPLGVESKLPYLSMVSFFLYFLLLFIFSGFFMIFFFFFLYFLLFLLLISPFSFIRSKMRQNVLHKGTQTPF